MQDVINNVVDILGRLAQIITSIVIIGGFFISITGWGKKLLGNWLNKIFKVTLTKEFEPISKGIEINSKAIKCVLRSDIVVRCNECIEKGYITIKQHEDLTEANDAYVGLNGNSHTRGLVKIALSLPIRG